MMKHIIFFITFTFLFGLRLEAQVSFGKAANFNDGWLFQLADDSAAVGEGYDDCRTIGLSKGSSRPTWPAVPAICLEASAGIASISG